jgi:CheY-like chemotaxis protein
MKATVLVVDDQAEVRKLVCLALEFGDYEILEATGGAEALALIERHAPEVVILDIMMPGEIDGYEVCRRIKASGSDAFVCLLSARGQKGDIERGREVGAHAYIVKPFSPLELTAIVEEATGQPRRV